MEERLRGVWRIDLGCFVVLGDCEKSPLKDLRGVWRKYLGDGNTPGEQHVWGATRLGSNSSGEQLVWGATRLGSNSPGEQLGDRPRKGA